MNGRIDVLAVLDKALDFAAGGADRGDISEARAAVAELIGAANELANDQVHTDLDEPDYEPEVTEAAIARNKGQRAYWRVVAAVARVGGAT